MTNRAYLVIYSCEHCPGAAMGKVTLNNLPEDISTEEIEKELSGKPCHKCKGKQFVEEFRSIPLDWEWKK